MGVQFRIELVDSMYSVVIGCIDWLPGRLPGDVAKKVCLFYCTFHRIRLVSFFCVIWWAVIGSKYTKW